MKLLYLLALGVALASCSKTNDPAVAPVPTEPFLGHWEGHNLLHQEFAATGEPTATSTTAIVIQLDVTDTMFTSSWQAARSQQITTVSRYVRNGESITFTPQGGPAGNETSYIRNLTPTSFTLESDGPRTPGMPYYINTMPYKR